MIANAFATEWEAAWNAHDLGRILSHYDDGIIFRSLKAARLVGAGELRGKPALERYWGKALTEQPDLHFRVQDVFQGYQVLLIIS